MSTNGGIFTFLMGIIVIVFAGIALSLMVDGRNGSLQFNRSIHREIELNTEEIAYIKSNIQYSSDILEEMVIAQSQASKLRGHQKTLPSVNRLLQTVGELNTGIVILESSFKSYRSEYIRQSRKAAIGEKIGNVRLHDGREYINAVIKSVTDVGLEIQHDYGIGRVQAPDLSQELQERFQWNDEERRQRLKEEEDHRNQHLQEILAKSLAEEKLEEASSSDSENEKKSLLQTRVKALRTRAQNLKNEKSETDHLVRYSPQKSVPGSLESTREKSIRLAKEYSKTRNELSLAIADLAEVSPQDELLQETILISQEQF
ncbi:MAG: hypothetical protein HC845_14645 [Akkermansiaceae bacterium]|nr:hypothetical protein [Akkermansiaceae bacterium]